MEIKLNQHMMFQCKASLCRFGEILPDKWFYETFSIQTKIQKCMEEHKETIQRDEVYTWQEHFLLMH